METERILINKILNGNLKAFKNLVERYQKLVIHVIFRSISDREKQEDICQEVFLKVYQNLAGFKFQSKLSTWIAKIAYTTTLNYVQKEKLQQDRELKQTYDEESENACLNPVDSVQTKDPSPLERIEGQDVSAFILKKIEKLPAPYSTIITLYHLEQMSYQEITEIMDLPEGTVKSYLFRGRKKLKASLIKELEGEGWVRVSGDRITHLLQCQS